MHVRRINMRSFCHWTPRYIVDRLSEYVYQKTHPDLPWLTKTANTILTSCLKETDVGLEFGSGRSTVWLAKQTKHVTSVEHDEVWHKNVKELFERSGIDNVDYHFIPIDVPNDEGNEAAYVKIIDTFEVNSLDYVLVDGKYRGFCALNVLEKIRPGGMLIIDNVNWFLPSASYAPNSRTNEEGPNGPIWGKVDQALQRYRKIWTSSGVSDTAFFIKPCS